MKKRGPLPKDYSNFKNEYFQVIRYNSSSTWKCKCNCGEVFYTRTNKIESRKGCIHCTASIVSANKHPDIEHYSYKKRVYKDYKKGAEKRNLIFNLSFESFLSLISSNCYFCDSPPQEVSSPYLSRIGEPLQRNGIDRLNPSKGYFSDNVVACCSKCNYAKHEMSVDEFKEWVQIIYTNLFKETSTTISKESTPKRVEVAAIHILDDDIV